MKRIGGILPTRIEPWKQLPTMAYDKMMSSTLKQKYTSIS